MIQHSLNPQVRVLDDKSGTIEYIASDESLDADREIVRLSGWRFDLFQKNAPFVDSHKYGSIDAVLGKVLDARLEGNRLIETAQWAIDVPENILAQRGYAMTKAGYLKAVSVGFDPVKIITTLGRGDWPDHWQGASILSAGSRDGKRIWANQMLELGLAATDDKPLSIVVEQQQLELSACVVGANPNAIAKSYKAGILSDADLDLISIERSKRETAWLASESAAAIQARQRKRAEFWEKFQTAIKSI